VSDEEFLFQKTTLKVSPSSQPVCETTAAKPNASQCCQGERKSYALDSMTIVLRS